MQIRSVSAHLLSFVLPRPLVLRYHGGTREIVKRDAMLIRVEAANGLVGYAPGEGSEQAAEVIRTVIAPWLEGRRLLDPDALRVKFSGTPGATARARRIYSTVEIALYDLLGKFHETPVSELLGGRVRDRIKCYGSAGMYQDPEGYAREAALCRELGFAAYKMRPALGPERDLEAVRQMRAATGPAFGLMVDAHSWWRMGDRSYTPETVTRLAGEMAESDLTWLEEPLPPADHDAYRELRETGVVPVAAGEHEHSEEGFLDLIHTGCVDYLQMDVVCQGGYALGKRLFGELQSTNLRFAFHSWGSALEVAAAAQIGVCWPETVIEWMELPLYRTAERDILYEFPLADEILAEPLDIEAGDLVVPRGPGLGVRVDEGVIERYPWVPGPWSYFTLDSPPGRFAVTGDHADTGLDGLATPAR